MKFKKCSNCIFFCDDPGGYEDFPDEGLCLERHKRGLKSNKNPACEKYKENYYKSKIHNKKWNLNEINL
jgi:hypothetical protein